MTSRLRPPPVWLLVAATATGPLALNLFVPSMPGLVAVFGAERATVQLTLSLYLIGVAVGQLVYGPLSDRFGRRPVLLAGLGLYLAASVACAAAPGIGTLIAGRVAQAVGGCAGMVIVRAIVRDAWDRDQATRVLAAVIAGMAVAPMVGPAMGGLLDEWAGWRAGLVLIAGFGALVLAVAVKALPETHHDRTPMPGPGAMALAYARLLRRRAFLGNTLVTALNSAGFFAFLAGAPYATIGVLGRTPSEYGLLFGLLSVGYIAGNMAVSRLAGRVAADRLMMAGLCLSALGPLMVLGMMLDGLFTVWSLFLPATLMSLGNGLVMPVSIAAAVSAEPRLAGTASGLLGFLQMGMGAMVSVAVGALKAWEPATMVVSMVLLNLAAFAAFAYARRGT